MITDKLLRVSTDQALTTTAVSTDTIDLNVARDMGEGGDLYMNFAVTTALAGGTSVKFEVIGATNAALSSGVVVLGSSDAVITADLVAGKNVAVRINPQIASTGQRYLGARYTIVGTFTSGNVLADVVMDIQDGKKFYASGFTVV
jgi:predicted RecA/RadA family phage recombinase